MNLQPGADLSGHTSRELFEYLEDQLSDGVRRQSVDRYAYVALSELEDRLNAQEEEVFVLPTEVVSALKDAYPKAGKRTFEAVEKRGKFAWQVWSGKYGPFTPEQASYAVSLLTYCITKGSENCRKASASSPLPFIYSLFGRVINHEDTHSGFQRRAGESIDITEALKEALA